VLIFAEFSNKIWVKKALTPSFYHGEAIVPLPDVLLPLCSLIDNCMQEPVMSIHALSVGMDATGLNAAS